MYQTDIDTVDGHGSPVNQNPQLLRAIKYFFAQGETFELCILGPRVRKSRLWDDEYISSGAGKKGLAAGWFDDPAKAASIAAQADSQASPEGIYLTLNPVNPALLGRANNRLKASPQRTNDSEISCLRHLLIDADPTRPAGVSSSDAEKAAAIDLLNHIQTHLGNIGWPDPLFAESGNGGHLIYRLPDLTNTQENIDLIKACLQALAAKYDTDQIKIDQKVFNPARISKLYGTHARKGDSTPDRPHRLAQIISAPAQPTPVPMDLIHALAALAPKPEPKPSPRQSSPNFTSDSQPLDVPAYLAKYGRTLLKTKQHGTSTLFILDECVFNPDHKGGEAAIGQTSDGKLFYQCYHNSCNGRTWHEARQLISGDEPLFERANKVVALRKDTDCTAKKSSVNATEKKVDTYKDINSKHAVVMLGGKCAILNEEYDPTFNRPCITFSSIQDFKYRYSNKRVYFDKNDFEGTPITKLWLQSEERRQYDGIVFEPSGECQPQYYNLWKGFGIEPKAGDWSLLQAHLLHDFCDGNKQHFEWLIAWLADAVQNPGGDKPGTSIVLRGDKGVGKGLFCVMFGEIFGNHFLHIRNPIHFLGRFNSHLKDALLVFVDEGFWAGDKSNEGVLKGLITEKYNLIEQKGKDVFTVKNHIRLMMASNDDWVIPATMSERRFFVLDVKNTHMQDKSYFGKIADQMKNGGREAMLYDLLNFDISIFDLRNPPKTQGLFDQILKGLDTHQKFWVECLDQGSIKDGIWPDEIKTSELYDMYISFGENIKERYPLTQGEFKKMLLKLCPCLSTYRPREGLSRPQKTRIPTLIECRNMFAQSLGMELKWEDTENPERSGWDTARSGVDHD